MNVPDFAVPQPEREIVLSRVLNAPRELVFEVWTRPEHVVQWWGPTGFTNTTHEMDVRPGGVWRYIMHGPDGTDYPNRMNYIEVVPPERLLYIHGDDGAETSADFHALVTFEARGNQTELTMRLRFASAEERDRVVKEIGAIEGGNQTLDRLEEYLAHMAS
ncbi:MAG: SRPBCC domain-containing protein [Candidatus Hydrogenedentes bacterium]|nr:SRPBCC domain-containing protein [Candidatus Hydrogenedentota bacterium]